MVGVGRGAQAGVLIKNAEAIERMEKVDTLVVDKTGTLTEGKPRLTNVISSESDFRAGAARGRCCRRSATANIRSPPRSCSGANERGIEAGERQRLSNQPRAAA